MKLSSNFKLYRIFLLFIFIVTFSILCVSCSSSANSQDQQDNNNEIAPSALDLKVDTDKLNLVKPGILTVGIAPPYAPFEYSDNGVLKGFDVDFAKILAKDLGLRIKYVQLPFFSLMENIRLSSKFDIAISAIEITDERCKDMNFSNSYFTDNSAYFCKTDNKLKSNELEDILNSGDATICTPESSTYLKYLVEHYPKCKVVECVDVNECIDTVNDGKADLLYIGNVEFYMSNNENKKYLKGLVDVYDNSMSYGVALPKEKTYLLDQVNYILQTRQEDDTISQLQKQYFSYNK